MGAGPKVEMGRNGSRFAFTKAGSRRGDDTVMSGTRCTDSVKEGNMDASGPSEDDEILVSQVEMMSEPRLLTWFVLTLYVAKLRRVRKS
jgi:hypothetical protein